MQTKVSIIPLVAALVLLTSFSSAEEPRDGAVSNVSIYYLDSSPAHLGKYKRNVSNFLICRTWQRAAILYEDCLLERASVYLWRSTVHQVCCTALLPTISYKLTNLFWLDKSPTHVLMCSLPHSISTFLLLSNSSGWQSCEGCFPGKHYKFPLDLDTER